MDEPSTVPPDVRLARAVRALRDAVIGCGGACLGLAAVAAAILLLSDADPTLTGPTVVILGGGQLIALVGTGAAVAGLRRVLVDRPAGPVLDTTRRRLGWLGRATLGWCVGAAGAWTLHDPSSALLNIALAAVTAQLVAVLALLRRRLARAGRAGR